MKDIAGALNESAQKSGYQTSRIENLETGQASFDIRDIGGGFNAYQDQNGQTSGFSRVDPSKPGMIQLYGPNGEFRGEQKITSTTQDLLKNLGPIAVAAGGSMLAQSLLGGSTALNTLGSAGTTGLTAEQLATMNALGGAEVAGGLTSANAAAAGLGGGFTGAAGAALGAGGSLLGAGGSLLGTAGSVLGTTLGQGLIGSAIANTLGSVANQSGINDARDAITQGSATANTALNNAYTNAQNLNTANTAALGTNYANLNTNLSNTLASQTGVYNTTGTNLANNYQNLGTTLKGSLADQVSAYNAANQGINTNAQNQLGLLSNTYEGQKAQAAANAAALNSNYNTTLGNMGNVYNQQVGFQQPYQDVGRAGSQGLINNQDYLTRQFGAADLNSQLAPNYAFQLQQGQMANQRAANVGGGSLGGNVLKGLQDYTQNYAAGAYQNAFNNFNTQRQNIYSTLAGMAGIGTTSGGQLASLGNTYGSNMGLLSSNLGGNLTTNAGNLLNAGNTYGSNTSGVTNNLNNVLSSNLGQLQGAYNQYGSNVTGASNAYAGNVVNNANTMQNAYNQYGSNVTGASNAYGGNLTAGAGQGINAANVYGLNSANLAIGTADALAGNAAASGANTSTALSNLGNTALLGSMIKAT
jgi:hypothetical protein